MNCASGKGNRVYGPPGETKNHRNTKKNCRYTKTLSPVLKKGRQRSSSKLGQKNALAREQRASYLKKKGKQNLACRRKRKHRAGRARDEEKLTMNRPKALNANEREGFAEKFRREGKLSKGKVEMTVSRSQHTPVKKSRRAAREQSGKDP